MLVLFVCLFVCLFLCVIEFRLVGLNSRGVSLPIKGGGGRGKRSWVDPFLVYSYYTFMGILTSVCTYIHTSLS